MKKNLHLIRSIMALLTLPLILASCGFGNYDYSEHTDKVTVYNFSGNDMTVTAGLKEGTEEPYSFTGLSAGSLGCPASNILSFELKWVPGKYISGNNEERLTLSYGFRNAQTRDIQYIDLDYRMGKDAVTRFALGKTQLPLVITDQQYAAVISRLALQNNNAATFFQTFYCTTGQPGSYKIADEISINNTDYFRYYGTWLAAFEEAFAACGIQMNADSRYIYQYEVRQ